MTELYKKISSRMSSFIVKIGKLKQPNRSQNPLEQNGQVPRPKSIPQSDHAIQSQMGQEANLQSLSDDQLKDAVSQLPERTLLRMLHNFENTGLQLRIVRMITNEAILKRISRSSLPKKVKRLAEKEVREITPAASEQRFQKLDKLTQRIQNFLKAPQWPQLNEAQDLLDDTFDPEMIDPQIDKQSVTFTNFVELRQRLKRKIEEHENTSKKREDLREKAQQPESSGLAASDTAKLEAARKQEAARLYQERAAEDRKARLDVLEEILSDLCGFRDTLRETSAQLLHPSAEYHLRSLQKELLALRPWTREFPEKLAEAESLLKELFIKRSELAKEAQWSTWARTELALRIQGELEATITQLETDLDPAIALPKALGLGQHLLDYAKEMRALGTLARDKDHKIWEQFKTLTDRGWLACDKMRLVVLEKLKTLLSEHTLKPIDFTLAAMSDPKLNFEFKITAFENEVSEQVKLLHTTWIKIGGKHSEANRETEAIFSKLLDGYFRQLKWHWGNLRHLEKVMIQKKRATLTAMKKFYDQKATPLAERVLIMKQLEEKWKNEPLPEKDKELLQREFDDLQSKFKSEVAEEIARLCDLATVTQTKVQTLLEQIRAKTEVDLSKILLYVSTLEKDIFKIDNRIKQVGGFSDEELKIRFQKLFEDTKRQLIELRTEIKVEKEERSHAKNNILQEAESLALSNEFESSQLRFEELKQLWKKMGDLGRFQDSLYKLLFENLCQFYQCRTEARNKSFSADERARVLKSRKELILSLEALTRFINPKTPTQRMAEPLPFPEEERAKAAGKVLELGLKYKQIFSLYSQDESQEGTIKEIKKIMEQWSHLGMPDEELLPLFWKYYLDRIHALLGI